MSANDPAHATPDRGNVYDVTRQAMHAASTDARLDAISAKIDDLSQRVDKRFEHLEERFFRLQLTLIGGGFAVIATLIAT